jgi:hypothetical protein
MTSRKKKRKAPSGPKEGQGERQRPYCIERSDEFKTTFRALAGNVRARLLPRVRSFEHDWRNQDLTYEDLRTRWDLKRLNKKGAKQWKVHQVDLNKDYRVALAVITVGEPCAQLVRVYLKKGKGKNEKDYEQAINAAEKLWDEAE